MLSLLIWADLFRCGSCKTFKIQIYIFPNNQYAKQSKCCQDVKRSMQLIVQINLQSSTIYKHLTITVAQGNIIKELPQMRTSNLVSAGSVADAFILTLISNCMTSSASGNTAIASLSNGCKT